MTHLNTHQISLSHNATKWIVFWVIQIMILIQVSARGDLSVTPVGPLNELWGEENKKNPQAQWLGGKSNREASRLGDVGSEDPQAEAWKQTNWSKLNNQPK